MKIIMLISALLATNLSFGQSFTVSSKKFSISAFPKKMTYSWVKENDSLSMNSYYLNDLNLKSDLERAIQIELQSLGCELKQIQPAVLVKYDVLKSPSRLPGINPFSKNANCTSTTVYNVEPGTLLISFIDPVTNKILWQGFASGLIDCQASRKNTVMVKEAVRLVFQEYAYLINNNSTQ